MAQISLLGKVKAEFEVKAPAGKMHEFCSARPHHTSKACPEKVQSVKLLEGQWGKQGCVTRWNLQLDGKAVTSKEILETIDYQNKRTIYNVIEGDLLELYSSFTLILRFTPKSEGSLMSVTLEYEKLKEDVPDPNTMLDFVCDVIKDVDAYLAKE